MTSNEMAKKLGYELKESEYPYKKAVYKQGVKIGDFSVYEFNDYLKEQGEFNTTIEGMK
ncbi:hypothetical protein B0P06_005293 [Clostridium saccharoperbutylacetonicum]|uniref:Uncharacterized protein n=1 Tax=Clostridium saccharoperbutylacetonicum N1-4(HMT) TaxID=931276 RepID=M1LTS5_9CLOT|nr:hypothetical protein [Clostridium saccharoperbutylacetonicum]AGF56440.1 hypothetical protein Cspa_c26750 [Clostridium saccharoperbutylacetonicum N1-4(HMT)]NRT62814.1 hypothetical protein [Clostridium saccharoperbutylacetonicum]NSB26168.1 hypothetical protein [Clostridium saccharoperbutylacetonicum]NSB45522.1 hypothetical protein [Clostridium saccharoperbutylacetonicum]